MHPKLDELIENFIRAEVELAKALSPQFGGAEMYPERFQTVLCKLIAEKGRLEALGDWMKDLEKLSMYDVVPAMAKWYGCPIAYEAHTSKEKCPNCEECSPPQAECNPKD